MLYGNTAVSKGLEEGVCLRVSTAMKRHHDQDNSYKENHLGAGLYFQRPETWWCAGRRSARGGAESSTSMLADSRKRMLHWTCLEHLRSQSPPLSDILPPTKPHLLIVPLPMGLWEPFYLKPPHCVYAHTCEFIHTCKCTNITYKKCPDRARYVAQLVEH